MDARAGEGVTASQQLEWMLVSFVQGFADLFTGLFRAYRYESKKTPQETEQPITTLARRRAARSAQQSTKSEQTGQKDTLRDTILKCLLFNCVMLGVSVVLFRGLIYGLEWAFANSSWATAILGWTGKALMVFWELPTFVLAKGLTSHWYSRMADLTFEKTKHRRQEYIFQDAVADLIFTVIMDLLFHVQGHVVYLVLNYLNLGQVAYVVYILHSSWLYSLYAFEYKWYYLGYVSKTRAILLESNWAYHVGFGLPLVLVSHISPSLYVSAVIFSSVLVMGIIASMMVDEPRDTSVRTLRLTYGGIKLADLLFIVLGRYCNLKPGTRHSSASSTPTHAPSPSPSPSHLGSLGSSSSSSLHSHGKPPLPPRTSSRLSQTSSRR